MDLKGVQINSLLPIILERLLGAFQTHAHNSNLVKLKPNKYKNLNDLRLIKVPLF